MTKKVKVVQKKWRALVKKAGPWYLGFIGNLVIAGSFFNWAEEVNIFESVWFALVTGSTTGFGDVLPDTTLGYVVAVYIILSSGFFDTMWKAMVLIVMIEEPHLYSDEEQERDEKLAVLDHALTLKIAEALAIDVSQMQEHTDYEKALEKCEIAEKGD